MKTIITYFIKTLWFVLTAAYAGFITAAMMRAAWTNNPLGFVVTIAAAFVFVFGNALKNPKFFSAVYGLVFSIVLVILFINDFIQRFWSWFKYQYDLKLNERWDGLSFVGKAKQCFWGYLLLTTSSMCGGILGTIVGMILNKFFP